MESVFEIFANSLLGLLGLSMGSLKKEKINLIKFESIICDFENNLQNEQECRLTIHTLMTDRNIIPILSEASLGDCKQTLFEIFYFQNKNSNTSVLEADLSC